jgi:gentisate 1,2-dioxygenase
VLGGAAERLDAGTSSPLRQETLSAVYHVVSGSGYSKVGDSTLVWKTGDTFSLPSWYKYQHFANAEETVYLYRFDDKPMITALGFYRTGDTDVESLVSD